MIDHRRTPRSPAYWQGSRRECMYAWLAKSELYGVAYAEPKASMTECQEIDSPMWTSVASSSKIRGAS
jgi:hypothetical protein